MGETNFPLVIAVGISLITLVLWSLLKKNNPVVLGEPPMLPGALPFLGHVVSLVRDANALHMYARQWTRDLAPVSISLVGQRVYFVLNPRDVQAVWKSKSLSFDTLVEGGLVSTFGMTAEGVEKLQSDPDGEGPMLVHNHTFFKEALAPGNLEDLTLGFIHYLDLELDKQVTAKIYASSDGYIDVKLQDWARKVLTIASTNALVGEQTLKQEPGLIERLWEWERDFQLLSFGLPKWMMKRAHKNREDMIKGFARHVFDKDAKPFVGHKEMLMRRRGMSDFDVGAGNFSLWYALQANSPLTAFWIIHYICFIPGLMAKIHTEIRPAFDASTGKLTNLPHLLNNCPLLNSIYHEVLRYTSAAVGIRQVEEDTILGGYTFIEGAIVMMPVRPNHFDPNVFGQDVDDFVPERFIRTEEELARSPGLKNPGTKVLKAFGGGTTLCPGRHFAANEILSSVAAILERFELGVVEGEKIAVPSSKEPTVGTYLADHDVKIRMRVRKRTRDEQKAICGLHTY